MTHALFFVCLVWVMVSGWASAGAPVRSHSPKDALNLSQIRREAELFENILMVAMRQSVPNPLLISEKVRGSYLEGYGMTFSATFNLNRSALLFSPRQKSLDENTVVNTIKERAIRTLWEYGSGLRQLPGGFRVSIILHVLGRSVFADETVRTCVITAQVRDLVTANPRMTLEEFKKKVRTVEY